MDPARGKLLLVSRSPRRRRLLETAGFAVEVRASDADESWPGGGPERGAVGLAERKLRVVDPGESLALAADTVVVIDGERLGKPEDAENARQMLMRLAGREHQVVTGFVVVRGAARHVAAVTTRVWFRSLRDAEIERYVSTREPYDKAGAYAIQGEAGAFIARVEGSYTNVVGLPLPEVLAAVEVVS